MPETTTTASTAGQASGGTQTPDVAAIVAKALEPFAQTLKDLATNQKILADTFTANQQAADPKATDKGKAKADAEAPKSLTLEDVQKLLADRDSQASKSATRKKALADLVAKGVPEEIAGHYLPAEGDEAAFAAASVKAIERTNAIAKGKPVDVGSHNDGGSADAAAKPAGPTMPKSAYAQAVKLPA